VERFGGDLRKTLGISLAHLELKQTEDFEQFLRERKECGKVLTEDTIKYYRSLFPKLLKGKNLSEEL